MDLFPNEEIKQIKNYPNYYITTFGRIWSDISQKWLKPTISQRGNHQRLYVSLGRGNKYYVHRLVAEAFIPNPNNLDVVDHIDTNGLNNNVNNLRWVTQLENLQNILTQEKIKKNTGYLVEIENIETGELTYGYKETAEKNNVSIGTINNHVNNKVKHPKWRLTGKRINPEIINL